MKSLFGDFTIHIHADGDFTVLLDEVRKLSKLTQNIGDKMVTQEDINAIVAQIQKGTAEVVAKIAELQAQNPTLDLTALSAAAQALDDIVADPVV